MLVYDKKAIKEAITTEDIFNLLIEWGGEPTWFEGGIISTTICHNPPGEGSRKLYYYENSGYFQCYTGGCSGEPLFDLYELTRKIFAIQKHKEIDLNEAIRYIAARLGIAGSVADKEMEERLVDWDVLSNYDRIESLDGTLSNITLKEYDHKVLDKFNYSLKILPWLREGITQEVMDKADIGYYLGGDQITIPHFDINGRLVGIRGRTLCAAEAELYGKYRPLKLEGVLYTHALGFNLYGLNWAKENIARMGKAFVFESEKAVLQAQSYFGLDNSLYIACCGSNLSAHQMRMLLELGAKEVIIGFDRQYEELKSEECVKWSNKLVRLHNKYKNDCKISFMWDKGTLLGYKDSPTDKGAETFLELYKNRTSL